MRRISILACILGVWFVSMAWAQQPAPKPSLSRHNAHRMANLLSKAERRAQPGNYLASATTSGKSKIWDLGVYPGGTTAALQSINDFGVAMGWGDVPIEGATETRMIGIPLFGFNAGQWFESGISAGENDTGEAGGISNTGIIVGNIMDSNGWPVAYAWMPGHIGFHLGKYADDDGSIAIAINHSGTFIVGNSGKLLADGSMRVTPLVWVSKAIWKDGRPTLSWEMHALPTGGFEKPGAVFESVTLNFWGGWGVNDFGQIAGDGWTYDPDSGEWWEIAVVWTPIKDGKEWKIQRLPTAAGFTYNEALAINDFGEIVGDVWGANAFPALYKQNPRSKRWSVSVLPATPKLDYGWSVAWGINELGDIVGYCTDENWTVSATRWNSHDRRFVKSLGFPGDTSIAFGVNNLGIAVGGYQSIVSTEDGNSVYGPEQAVAVRFR
ncbi:MAG: hypothetical protein LAP86_11620 [Acidobacteriia bacterium]|nr:hypothetical protein [Terriglobia bacterium]